MRRGDYEVRNCLAACILRSACRVGGERGAALLVQMIRLSFSLLFLHFDKRFAIFANRNRINFPLFLSNIFIRVFIHFIVWRPACLPARAARPPSFFGHQSCYLDGLPLPPRFPSLSLGPTAPRRAVPSLLAKNPQRDKFRLGRHQLQEYGMVSQSQRGAELS